ncbi:hypothetical protein CGMCC3_g17767 [Colletotrichum fructicola]|uniref:Cyanovirin-N domain-containing protein n=1 Tax=Colletotrichum fructicola (strain Nara gc5) TaxID=1213859 RepID=A0A7J6ICD6_COLFN|nr:uncharacterized protein CGMCC3_g17767 [Colletotrichum fructicola]KAF4474009.1 hypothetical protein CGGC5_v017090 [Colletotrichum fructicola Nara gc5]KAE9566061.1 hypothetical protein CGMCC3_g17767 [Colletotrichum fructicola]KAF4417137.1 hypothetical protein CFRS1_v015852 [Colletotrichum fructicola]KAF4417960.1 hypothetical protein CFRS1_v015375 [Colletotrichum fructicola]KAF4881555.1 hypothetical protein CGCFRS4_v015434 [Colletotrichum fructicola]
MLSKHLAVTFCAIVVGQAHNLEKKTGPGAPDSNWKAADFIKTCQSWAFVDNEINAQCNDTTQRPVWSRLQLGHCLVNDGGSLKARNGGNFQGSCSECAIRESTLTCECKPEPNSVGQPAPIDLNQVLGNFAGRLCCGENNFECGDGRLYNDTDAKQARL